MSIEMSEPLSVPFSEITDLLGTDFSPSVVGIAGRAYLLDNQEGDYKRGAVNVVEQRNTTSNRDLLLLPQGVWRYMFESWHQGAGQTNLDRDEALPYRFWESYGVDVWDKFHLSLLNDTEKLNTGTLGPTTSPCFLIARGDSLLTVHDGKVETYADGLIGQHSFTSYEFAPGKVTVAVADDGIDLWAVVDDGTLFEVGSSGTWATVAGVTAATAVGYVKDYLVVADGNVLKNITDPAKPVTVYTSPVLGFKWTGFAEGPGAIYAAGYAGDKGVIHRVGIKDDGTGLNPAVVAAQLPDGEIPVSIGSYLGFIFIGSNKGVRMAVPTGQGDLTLGALIPTSKPVYGFEGQDRFVWFTNSAVNGKFGQGQEDFPIDPVAGLGRLDLTTFTVTEGTPAYANDLAVDTMQGTVRSVVTWNGRRVFSVDGEGVYAETLGVRRDGGWVTHGNISFGVEDLKTSLYAQFKWQPLEGIVGMWAAYDSERYTRLAENAIPSSIRSGNVTMDGQQFSRISIGLILRPNMARTDGPHVSRWEFRAVPTKGLASRWSLPVLNRAQIELNGTILNRDPRAELARLLDLVQRGGMFALQEGGVTYQVTPKDYEWRPEVLDDTGRSWQGTFVLVVEEIR